jgi:hypothetical protein
MQLFANLLKLTASTPEGSSTIAMTGEKIELTTGKFIVNSTNLQIDAQGNGTFSGTVSAANIISSTMSASSITGGTITGSEVIAGTVTCTTITGGTVNGTTINGSSINGGETIRFKARPGYIQVGDFEVDDTYGRHIFQSYDEVTGMSTGDASGSELLFWAGWDGTESFLEVNASGGTHCNGNFYYNGTELRTLILGMINEYGGGDDSGGGGNEELVDTPAGGGESGGESGGPTGDENDPILGGN